MERAVIKTVERRAMEFKGIETERLEILPFARKYLKDYYEGFTREVTKYQYPEPFESAAAAEAFLEEFLKCMERGEMLELMMLTKEKEFVGSFEVFGLKEEKLEMGLWLREDMQGLGYGSEAVEAVIAYLKAQGKYHSCIYEADERNYASIALVEKFDAKLLGCEPVTTEAGKKLRLLQYEICL